MRKILYITAAALALTLCGCAPKDVSREESPEVSQDVQQDISEEPSADVSEDISADVSEDVSSDVSEDASEEPSVEPTEVTLSFTEAAGEVTNPERGMMSYSKFNLTGGNIPAVASIPVNYTGESLAFILFYLTDYMDKDLDQAALDFIGAELGKVRERNMKAILRFAYEETHTSNTQHEATPTQILAHLQQVAGLLSANADIIYLVQAGWLGTYGEWYYKTNNNGESVSGYNDYYKYTVSGNSVTDFNGNHKALVDKMLEVVPSPIQIGLRTAFYKRYYLSPSSISSWTPITSWGTSPNDRLAFYNDGFRGSASGDDVGTFKSQTDWDMWYSQGDWLACGGELSYRSQSQFDALPDANKDADLAIAEMRRQHFSYLHYSTSNRFMAKWYAENRFDDIEKAMGYRLVLKDVSLTYPNLGAGSNVNYSISIGNTGCARVIYPRPCKLVLLHGNAAPVVLADLGDARDIAPGDTPVVINGSVAWPQDVSAGDCLAIWLPDSHDSLRDNAAYSIRLANKETSWQSGCNVIHTF